MSESNNSSPTSDPITEPDKETLWGWWREANKWQQSLHRKATHKALDIPDDMGDIEANKVINSGMGWKELAVLGGLGLGGLYVVNDKGEQVPLTPPPAVVQPAQPIPDSEYEVRFFDKDGNQIMVPRYTPPN